MASVSGPSMNTKKIQNGYFISIWVICGQHYGRASIINSIIRCYFVMVFFRRPQSNWNGHSPCRKKLRKKSFKNFQFILLDTVVCRCGTLSPAHPLYLSSILNISAQFCKNFCSQLQNNSLKSPNGREKRWVGKVSLWQQGLMLVYS